jgi:uncharacterized protein (TIGR03083 family)
MSDTASSTSAIADRDHVWRVIDGQRATLADLLEDLSEDEWRQPSLCTDWTVRDVAAHLTLQQLGIVDVIRTMVHWRDSIDRTIGHAARRHAATRSTQQIVSELRGMIGSQRHTVGVTHREVLVDILVHGQDISMPLGRRHDMPPAAAALAASRILSMRWPPPLASARKIAGCRLVATDVRWSIGSGPEARGPMSALLLVCAGRAAALPQLTGDAVADLADRLATSART